MREAGPTTTSEGPFAGLSCVSLLTCTGSVEFSGMGVNVDRIGFDVEMGGLKKCEREG